MFGCAKEIRGSRKIAAIAIFFYFTKKMKLIVKKCRLHGIIIALNRTLLDSFKIDVR